MPRNVEVEPREANQAEVDAWFPLIEKVLHQHPTRHYRLEKDGRLFLILPLGPNTNLGTDFFTGEVVVKPVNDNGSELRTPFRADTDEDGRSNVSVPLADFGVINHNRSVSERNSMLNLMLSRAVESGLISNIDAAMVINHVLNNPPEIKARSNSRISTGVVNGARMPHNGMLTRDRHIVTQAYPLGTLGRPYLRRPMLGEAEVPMTRQRNQNLPFRERKSRLTIKQKLYAIAALTSVGIIVLFGKPEKANTGYTALDNVPEGAIIPDLQSVPVASDLPTEIPVVIESYIGPDLVREIENKKPQPEVVEVVVEQALDFSRFAPGVRAWEPQIIAWSALYGIDDPLMAAMIMQIESVGDPYATSPGFARGLFQVMDDHFAPGEDPYDPDTNARRGLSYLRAQLDAFDNNIWAVCAAYNGGPKAGEMYLGRITAEQYVGFAAAYFKGMWQYQNLSQDQLNAMGWRKIDQINLYISKCQALYTPPSDEVSWNDRGIGNFEVAEIAPGVTDELLDQLFTWRAKLDLVAAALS